MKADRLLKEAANLPGQSVALVGFDPSGVLDSLRQVEGASVYQVNLADVVDKFIGETEKNIDAVFTKAEQLNAILLFDEADALFGKRSTVRDSHDRFADAETAYLLHKIKHHPRSVLFVLRELLADRDSLLLRYSRLIDLIEDDQGSNSRCL